MTLRRKFLFYLFFIHIAVAVALILLLWDNRIWLLAVELFFLISFLIALRLYRGLFEPLELIASGVEFMRDGDFTTHLRDLGQPEMDNLISVYNQMIDQLRTERVKMQEQHYFLEKILSVSPAAIITLDYDGRVSFVNPAVESILEMKQGELTGRKLNELALPLARELDGLQMGQSAILHLRGVRKVKVYKSHFLDQGHPRTFFLIEELTEELRRTEKTAYEKLIRMLAHEVNNSLGAANSLLNSCLHYRDQLKEGDRNDFETALVVAIERTEHLSAFMKSFADIVKLPLPHREPADVRAMLRNLVSLMSADLEARNIRVLWNGEHAPGSIGMDTRQMEQVFLNILKNATEAVGKDGTITISLGKSSGREYVSIQDTGSGISDETRRYLFTPFFSTKEHGQGIGLTLVQEILTRHKFEFSLDSAPGKPTEFKIWFS